MPRTRTSDLAGFLAIDKPAGWTSHDVVAKTRRLTNVRRVGHAGTLDPFATGLLVVGVGKATRLIQYVQNTTKTYEATFKLGAETDTFDPEGEITRRAEPLSWPSPDLVSTILSRYTGTLEQVPPAYSAVHVDGKRAYELARAGQDVDIPARTVTIHAIEITCYEPPMLDLTIVCSTGTYIRSLARDIGRELGTYAYCEKLRRTSSGAFDVEHAISLDAFDPDTFRESWADICLPPDAAVQSFEPVELTGAQTTAWYHGQSLRDGISAPGSDTGTVVRVYAAGGSFAGLGRFEAANELRPVLVFNTD